MLGLILFAENLRNSCDVETNLVVGRISYPYPITYKNRGLEDLKV